MDEVCLFGEFYRLAFLDDAHPFEESSRLSYLDDVHPFKESDRRFSFWDDVHPFKESYRHFSFWDDVHPSKESYRLSLFRTFVCVFWEKLWRMTCWITLKKYWIILMNWIISNGLWIIAYIRQEVLNGVLQSGYGSFS